MPAPTSERANAREQRRRQFRARHAIPVQAAVPVQGTVNSDVPLCPTDRTSASTRRAPGRHLKVRRSEEEVPALPTRRATLSTPSHP